MSDLETTISKHYGRGGIMDRIESGLRAAGKDLDSLEVDDLASIDAFHTRGRGATLEVAALANLSASDTVIDVGCGLGGTARFLAGHYKCDVAGVDLTDEYVSAGVRLTELVGLSDRVELRQGSALEIPYDDGRFSVAWTEHVQMNIADKNRFYSEISRVLKPGGRLLFHDVFCGSGDTPIYPVPWAEDASMSALATVADARLAMEQAGLAIDQWIGRDSESIEFLSAAFDKIESDGPPPIGIHLLMGDNARDKLKNYVRNLSERRTTVALGMAIKP
jgi:MPBQ/MSBQ methyltransferase